jgi:hypothetical protein
MAAYLPLFSDPKDASSRTGQADRIVRGKITKLVIDATTR